jgi:hypothetical protein
MGSSCVACDEFFRTDLQFVQAGCKLRAVQHAVEFLEQRGRDAQHQSCIFRRNEDGVGSADPQSMADTMTFASATTLMPDEGVSGGRALPARLSSGKALGLERAERPPRVVGVLF